MNTAGKERVGQLKTVALTYTHKVKSLSRIQLFATPWTVAYQAPLPMGFFRQEYWNWLPCPPPGDLPDSGIKLATLAL